MRFKHLIVVLFAGAGRYVCHSCPVMAEVVAVTVNAKPHPFLSGHSPLRKPRTHLRYRAPPC